MKEGTNGEEAANSNEIISFERTVGLMSVPEFDPNEFLPHIEGFDLTEEQQIEVLKALWAMAVAFVDLGFRTEPEQQVIPAVAQFLLQSESLADFSGQADSESIQKTMPLAFSKAATDTGEGRE